MDSIHVILPKVPAWDAEDAALEISESMRLVEALGLTRWPRWS